MPTDPVRVVCFDWGGVIVRICRTWREAAERAGLPVHESIDRPDLDARRQAASFEHQLGRIDAPTFFARIAEATDGAYSVPDVERIYRAWLIEEYAGVGEVIDCLCAHDAVRTGLLSNTNEVHCRRHLPRNGSPAEFPTIGRLHHRVFSHEVGLAKPDPAIYRAFEEECGVAGPRILFFDDLEANIEAARAIGWRAEQIDHAGDTAEQIERHLIAHRVW